MSGGQLTERRAGEDRRSTTDRRSGLDRRSGGDRRLTGDRRSNLVYLIADGGQRQPSPISAQPDALVAPRTPPLEQREFSLLDAVSQVYDAALNPPLWAKALAGLGAILGADAVCLIESDTTTDFSRLLHWFGSGASGTEAASAAARLEIADSAREPGSVSMESSAAGGAAFAGGRAWRTWVQDAGFSAVLRATVDNVEGRITQILFFRTDNGDPYAAEEAERLARLVPGIQRGVRAGRALRRAQFFHQIAFDALDAVPIGVAFVDSSGDITAANRIARQIIESEHVRAYQETVRRAEPTARTPRLRRAVAEAMMDLQETAGEALSAFAVTRRTGLRPLTCLLAPLGARAEYDESDGPSAMLFIGDPDKPMEIDQRRLRQLYGLSRAEARVVALLAQGYKLDATAESLGLVYETVRKHLKQVFDKTGCDRQAELVRLLVTGPATLPL